ncbi:hypothetical protein [Actinomadura flavalba]|uniref:hypothetical protein n=1 Tax=Actinomadura flavalba TaxID=1120938 RepID=UPI0004771B2F|nr:hypothetical protein [Actinomadura flavalba]
MQRTFSRSGTVALQFDGAGDAYGNDLFSYRHGRVEGRDCLLKTALTPEGARVLRREAEVYDRLGEGRPGFGRLLGFQSARGPSCLLVTRRGAPIDRSPDLVLVPPRLNLVARDLFDALDVLDRLGFRHCAVSAAGVSFDGLNIEMQELGHVQPNGRAEPLQGSALSTPTGLPVDPAPDVLAAARLVHRLATGQGGGKPPAAMLADLERVDPGLARALEPAFHAEPGQSIPAHEVAAELRRSRPAQPPARPDARPSGPGTAPRAATAEHRDDAVHRAAFRELRRRQREARDAVATPAAATAQTAPAGERTPPRPMPPRSGRSVPVPVLTGLIVVLALLAAALLLR